MSELIKLVGGHQAAKRILLDKPAGAVYWDREDSTYIKNFTVNSDEFEWQYLTATGEWNYCNSEVCPLTNGDFIDLGELKKLVHSSTQRYINQYYLAHQAAQAQLVSDQVHINVAEAKHAKKVKRHTAFWLCALALLVVFTLIVRGCVWVH